VTGENGCNGLFRIAQMLDCPCFRWDRGAASGHVYSPSGGQREAYRGSVSCGLIDERR
jgi:hypothetical protein